MAIHDVNRMISYLTEKWGVINCPLCHGDSLEVQDKVFQLSEFHQGNLVVGGTLVPVIPITCTSCGYTILVNALVSKAIAPVPAPAPAENNTREPKA